MNGQVKQDVPRRRRRNEKGPHKPTIADVAKVAGFPRRRYRMC
jgi:hypothetical protein